MLGWTHFSGLAVGDGKVFATTHDGAVYAFGLQSSRSAASHTTIIPGSPVAKILTRPQTPAGVVNTPECGTANARYKPTCATCHGPGTHNFTDPDWQARHSDQELIDVLTKGADKGMQGFEGQMTSVQIDQMIHCLVRGFARAPQGRLLVPAQLSQTRFGEGH